MKGKWMMHGSSTAVAAAAAAGMLAFAGCSRKIEEAGTMTASAGKAQTTCPIMKGNPINRSIYVDHEGKRVYFCCAGCPETFKKDPEKYMEEFREQGIELEDAPPAAGSGAPGSHEGHEMHGGGSGMKSEGE